jgi:hypothetical protein
MNMSAEKKPPLLSHRVALANNPQAYSADVSRLSKTAVNHLKQCGYTRVTQARCGSIVDKFVSYIFDTQDRLPFFHIDGNLPFCWNSPKDWDKNFICYEWGHLRSKNQNADAYQLENLCLQSARCNQHIQTSMDISEVLIWLDGSKVAERTRHVLEKREKLFASDNWKNLVKELAHYT